MRGRAARGYRSHMRVGVGAHPQANVGVNVRGKALTAQPPTTPILPAWPLYLPESRGGGMSLESASRSRVSAVMEVVTKRRGRSAGLEVEDEGWRVEPTRVPMRSG
jgi:hypothetical protein